MTRSLKKNPFVANHLLRKINTLNTKAEKEKSDTTGQGSVMNNNQATIKVDTTIDNKDEE